MPRVGVVHSGAIHAIACIGRACPIPIARSAKESVAAGACGAIGNGTTVSKAGSGTRSRLGWTLVVELQKTHYRIKIKDMFALGTISILLGTMKVVAKGSGGRTSLAGIAGFMALGQTASLGCCGVGVEASRHTKTWPQFHEVATHAISTATLFDATKAIGAVGIGCTVRQALGFAVFLACCKSSCFHFFIFLANFLCAVVTPSSISSMPSVPGALLSDVGMLVLKFLA